MAPQASSESRGLGGTGRALAVLLGLLLCGVVVAATSFDIRRQGQFPHDSATGLSPVLRAFSSGEAADNLMQAPVAGFPLWEESVRRASAGDTTRARLLALEAVRRDPQLAAARFWLAADAMKHGRLDAAIWQLDWLYTLEPAQRPQFAKVLAELAKDPRGRTALENFRDRKPLWLPAVTEELMQANTNPAVIFRLLGGTDARDGSLVVDKSKLVQSLVAREDYDSAYLTWVSALPQAALSAVGYIYDATFREMPGALPFNWNLVDSDAASVDYIKGGGVRIAYFGNTAAHFLDQTLLLPPGRYRFAAMANSVGGYDANRASWTIACAKLATPLGQEDVPTVPSLAVRATTFNVPPNCPAQRLSLDGTPSEFPVSAEIQVKAVVIVRVGEGR